MLFIFDANFSYKLAEGLDLLEKGNFKSALHAEVKHIDAYPLPTGKSPTDPEVIVIAGKAKGIIITLDDDFVRIKHLARMFKDHNVGVVWFKSYKDVRGYWAFVRCVIDKWEDIKEKVSHAQTPFVFYVDKKAVQKMNF